MEEPPVLPDWDNNKDLFSLNITDKTGNPIGQHIVQTHGPDKCRGSFCVLHNPSDHHMRMWEILYVAHKNLTIRICPTHAYWHPDPDDLNYHRAHGRDNLGIHQCCGCCQAPDPNGGLIVE